MTTVTTSNSNQQQPQPQQPPPPSTTPTSNEQLKLLQYEVLERIGRGTFGRVYKIRRISDGEILVWKEVPYGDMCQREREQLVSEVNILRDLNHAHIVRYIERIIDYSTKTIFIVTEYCEGGDLAQAIRRRKKANTMFSEDFVWKVLSQVCDALSLCHSKDHSNDATKGRVVHRDIKPANLFLDGKGNVKLGDFGLSRRLDDTKQMASTHVGTPYYMSPEQVQDNLYNEKSDMWSLGCLLYELCTFRPPFRAPKNNYFQLADKIRAGVYEPVPGHYTDEIHKMIRRLLSVDPSQRPSVQQVMDHAIVASHLREERVARRIARMDARQRTLLKKEQEMRRRERQVAARERQLAAREQRLVERENSSVYDNKNHYNDHHHRHRHQQKNVTTRHRKLSSSEPTATMQQQQQQQQLQ